MKENEKHEGVYGRRKKEEERSTFWQMEKGSKTKM